MEEKTLLEEMKVILRVTSSLFDNEVQMLIDGAKADMKRVGINEGFVDSHEPLVKRAIACYCKAQFGFDNEAAKFYNDSYRQIVCDLLNSSENVACEVAESE